MCGSRLCESRGSCGGAGEPCVKLSTDADLKAACYNTLGAIALQGIRQADLRLGEVFAP